MAKTKKKITKEEKLAKDRQRKREKYGIIKNNPELYAIQKEKERKRYLLRKQQKKVCSVTEMTPRAQREQRKRWRVNTSKYLKRKKQIQTVERILLDNSPPPSDAEIANIDEIRQIPDPLQLQPTRQAMDVKTRIRKLRYKHLKEVKHLKAIINNLKVRINNRETKKNNKEIEERKEEIDDSVKKRVDDLMSEVQGEKREEIKKKLLFGEAISKNLKEEYKTLNKKNKRTFAEQIIKNRDQMKKYQVLTKAPFPCRNQKKQPTVLNTISEKIHRFLEDDSNSSVAPGKNEYIKCNRQKKQKRYLRDTLGHLHDKFCKEEIKVGYSTFCRFRPAWIVSPKTRDTCGCKLHSNVDLMLVSLKKAGIIDISSSTEMLKYMCCNATNEECLERQCPNCRERVINYQEFNNEEKINYYQWLTEKQSYKGKDGKDKTTKVTIKKKLEDYPRNMIQNFEELTLPMFLLHVKNIALQYASIKALKNTMTNNEILIHIDFSENYCLKYNSEIQSFHFGGSRGQVSLHTGILYYKDNETGKMTTKSFCTVSKCLQHDAASVWAHLIPVLNMAKDVVSSIKVVHFLSDSPTSQYRNKFIFYMMTQLKQHLPDIERVTWNYQEAGHGKGAPDGIGAVVKRTADQFVNQGGDVGSFENFVEVISQNLRNVKIIIIEEESILNTKFPGNIPTFKGTMNVHQAIWCISLPHTVAFRNLSCFMCESSYIPCHHKRHLGVLSTGIDSKHTKPREPDTENTGVYEHNERSNEVQNQDLLIHDEIANNASEINMRTPEPVGNIYDLKLDTPTIRNNINDIDDILSQIDDQHFWNNGKTISSPTETTGPETTLTKTTGAEKVTILSNVKFDWQNRKLNIKNPKSLKSCQEEFEKFVTGTIEETTNIKNDSDKENKSQQCCSHNVSDWVVVQYKIKSQVYAYIGKIKEISEDSTYTIQFLKKTSTKASTFSWPTVIDEDTIPESRIFCTLQIPDINRRGQYSFKDLPDLKFR